MSPSANSQRVKLDYPNERAPEHGTPIEVAPGVFWLRLPLPFALNHINLYLIEDGPGWAVVDCGVDTTMVREMWEGVFSGLMGGRPLTKVIATHLHPDHIGLAGWLVRRFDADFYMTRTEYTMCRMLVADTGREAPPEGVRFYKAAGFNQEQIDVYKRRFGGFGNSVSALPEAFIRLKAGDRMMIGGSVWDVVIGAGHSPEHAALYCAERDIFISGDQVLPTISSNVSVWPTEPLSDPLNDWLESCTRIPTMVPDSVLVLPGHQKTFRGLHARCAGLLEEHEEGIAKLHAMVEEPKRAVDVFTALFRREITGDLVGMATGEALAHLNCLYMRGRIVIERDSDGVDWYRQA